MTSTRQGHRVVVTGATGFVGQVLVKQLSGSGYRVIGVSESKKPPQEISDHLDSYYSMDLATRWPDVGRFDGLVHLAGLAAVGPSFEEPQKYISVNSGMLTNFFEGALRSDWAGRALVVSSGAVYGGSAVDRGYTEDSSLVATSPYVISKLLVERQTEYYARRGIDAVVVRPFNHIGPGQHRGFILPDLAARLAEWQPGLKLPVGNLDSARDYTDVRDIASAYRILLELPKPRHAIYNVCSGVARSGWDILEAICNSLGREVPPTVISGQRAIDPSLIKGDSSRLRAESEWSPIIPLQQSVHDFLANISRN